MKIALITIEIYIPDSNSLKDRRNITNSIKERLRNRFNISIVDSSEDNLWKKSKLQIVEINNNSNNLQKDIEKITTFIENNNHIGHTNFVVEYL